MTTHNVYLQNGLVAEVEADLVKVDTITDNYGIMTNLMYTFYRCETADSEEKVAVAAFYGALGYVSEPK